MKKIEEQCTWDLSGIYKDDQEFYQNLEEFSQNICKIIEFKELNTKQGIKACFEFRNEMMKKGELLFCYAMMKSDKNAKDNEAQKMRDRVENVFCKFSTLSSFIVPAIASLSDEFLDELISDSELKDYDYLLTRIKRDKQHTLSKEEEAILAQTTEVLDGYDKIFSMIDNADLNLGTIQDSDGEDYPLTHGSYSVAMQDEDREFRKRAYEEYYKAFEKLTHVLATNYSFAVKTDWFYAKVRGYKSCLEASLNGNDVSPSVYENLIECVNGNLDIMNQYIKLKKKALKLDKFNMYDMYVPIVEEAKLQMPYEKACELVKEGLKPLGEEYAELLNRAFAERWIDVYETDGKRSGAYSMGVYGVHPFVLLNYQETTHDIFTIAHELGHSMHSYYSEKSQCYEKADYKIFVAEVASTVNEMLLIRHLQNTTKDKTLKKYLLNYFMEMVRTTLFRQTQFAEFEVVVHQMVEKNEPLTNEILDEVYQNLNAKYYGEALEKDDVIKREWSRIPHFYRSFYVYQYATGIISAIVIADNIISGKENAVSDYKKFLSSGGSASPVELLKLAGVDLTKKDAFENAMKVISETLKELESVML